jgi:predicted RNA binding protein YcfA (HicA-like mRNA interferase family)
MMKPMAGRHDADFSFNQLCSLLTEVGYTLRKAKGSHVIFHRDASVLNLQSAPGGKAKAYQVRQVRHELPNLNLKP